MTTEYLNKFKTDRTQESVYPKRTLTSTIHAGGLGDVLEAYMDMRSKRSRWFPNPQLEFEIAYLKEALNVITVEWAR